MAAVKARACPGKSLASAPRKVIYPGMGCLSVHVLTRPEFLTGKVRGLTISDLIMRIRSVQAMSSPLSPNGEQMANLLASSVTGAVVIAITNPLDCLKQRWQVNKMTLF